MKSKLVLAIATLALLGTYSCKETTQSCKLGKVYITNGSNTPNPNVFSYYDDGRLSKISYTNQNTDSLVYSADTLWVFTRDYRDSIISVFSGITNSSGFVTNGVMNTYSFNGTLNGTDSYTLTYNGDGTLNTLNISNSNGTTIYAYDYTDGNRSGGSKFVGAIKTEQYAYWHSSAANKTGISDDNQTFAPYFGSPSKNLLDSAWTITNADTIRVKYDHHLDRNDYVSSTTQTYMSPGFQTKYYTYDYFGCN